MMIGRAWTAPMPDDTITISATTRLAVKFMQPSRSGPDRYYSRHFAQHTGVAVVRKRREIALQRCYGVSGRAVLDASSSDRGRNFLWQSLRRDPPHFRMFVFARQCVIRDRAITFTPPS